jgi:hypothetical protein
LQTDNAYGWSLQKVVGGFADLLERDVGNVRKHFSVVNTLETSRADESELLLSVLQTAWTILRTAAGVARQNSFDRRRAGNRANHAKLAATVATAVLAMLFIGCCLADCWRRGVADAMQRGARLGNQQQCCDPNQGNGQAMFAFAHDESNPKRNLPTNIRYYRHNRERA